MSLLDTASLIVTPNGYKEGKLYSVIPSDGSGDMSVVRATTATRVNSAGLVELVPYNLLQYSEQIDNAAWGKVNATITSNATTAPDGTLTADKFESTSASPETQFFQAINSPSNTISFYAKEGNISTLNLWIGGLVSFNLNTGTVTAGTAIMENAGNGWWRCIVSTTYSVFNPFFSTTASGQFVYVWGCQANEGTIKDYQKTETRLNIPRLDYSNGTCPSLLVEPQRTNLVVQSNDMTQWAYGGGTMTQNATISPDGTNNALSFDNTSDCSTFVATSNGVYSWSLYVKQGTSLTASIDMSDGATGDVLTTFTFATKTFSGTTAGGSWTSPSASYIEYENGWFRITLTATKNAGSFIGHKINTSGSGYTYVYGAQLEAGSYSTSFIPTTSASVTRNADVISKTGISSLIGQTEGTLFVELDIINGAESLGIWTRTGVTPYNDMITILVSQFGTCIAEVRASNVTQFANSSFSIGSGKHKFALAYKANDFAFYIDGTQIATSSSGTPPTCDQVYLGGYPDGGARLSKNIATALWKTRLTNTQLATLTTL